jgi:hypothetical protein
MNSRKDIEKVSQNSKKVDARLGSVTMQIHFPFQRNFIAGFTWARVELHLSIITNAIQMV